MCGGDGSSCSLTSDSYTGGQAKGGKQPIIEQKMIDDYSKLSNTVWFLLLKHDYFQIFSVLYDCNLDFKISSLDLGSLFTFF